MLRLVAALGCLIVVAYACSDGHKSCPAWAKPSRNYCQTNKFVKKNCQKSCGTCSGGNGGSGGSGSNGQCGISKVSQSRVVNGVEAKPGAWPWIVSLQSSSGFHFCGATILTPNWVLTASHCVSRNQNNPGYFRMVAGAHNKNVGEGTQQKVGAKRVIMHPNYNSRTLFADVALIELSTPFRLMTVLSKLACHNKESIHQLEEEANASLLDGEPQVTQEARRVVSNKLNFQLSSLHTEVVITTEKLFAWVKDLLVDPMALNNLMHAVVILVAH